MTKEEFLNLKEGDDVFVIANGKNTLGQTHYFNHNDEVTFIGFEHPFGVFTNGSLEQRLMYYEIEKYNK